MNSWEARWSHKNPGTPPPREPVNEYPVSRFGADPTTVHYAAPQPVVMPQASSGGSFSNAIMLLLGGFAVGTLWGEGLINKALGGKHHQP